MVTGLWHVWVWEGDSFLDSVEFVVVGHFFGLGVVIWNVRGSCGGWNSVVVESVMAVGARDG